MEFRELAEWPGYRVSNTGIVESCRTNGGRLGPVWKTLKQTMTRDGYPLAQMGCRRATAMEYVAIIELRTCDGTQCKKTLQIAVGTERRREEKKVVVRKFEKTTLP